MAKRGVKIIKQKYCDHNFVKITNDNFAFGIATIFTLVKEHKEKMVCKYCGKVIH